MRREAFKFWDLVRLILETLRYYILKLGVLYAIFKNNHAAAHVYCACASAKCHHMMQRGINYKLGPWEKNMIKTLWISTLFNGEMHLKMFSAKWLFFVQTTAWLPLESMTNKDVTVENIFKMLFCMLLWNAPSKKASNTRIPVLMIASIKLFPRHYIKNKFYFFKSGSRDTLVSVIWLTVESYSDMSSPGWI